MLNLNNHQQLEELAIAAKKLNELFIPKINFGTSFMDAKAIEALNNFGTALRKLEETVTQ